jgi:hypothetical protein
VTDTSHSSHRWLQGWRGNLLLLMVSLVLCVVVAELGLRIAGKDTPEFGRARRSPVGSKAKPRLSSR